MRSLRGACLGPRTHSQALLPSLLWRPRSSVALTDPKSYYILSPKPEADLRWLRLRKRKQVSELLVVSCCLLRNLGFWKGRMERTQQRYVRPISWRLWTLQVQPRHLAFGGRRGHVAALDWVTKKLMCEINVMEAVQDIRFLHSEALLAVAQNRWLHIYDSQGIELHCIRRCDRVTRLEFLPFHFLLVTASETGFLTYLDVSVGKIVTALNARAGRLDVMTQNPYNAIIHLGHSNGTVSLWSPAVKEPLAKILCHRGGVRAVAVDSTGMYMATSGLDHQLKIFDLRGTFQPLSARTLPQGAGHLAFSQRGLLVAGMGDVVNIWAGQGKASPPSLEQPYLTHRLSGHVHGLQFCPFEDVLGVGHSGGITSMLVPGAAEPNFDGLESNPYRSRKQRQEWEVKALLEKVPAELICLDPRALAEVDVISLEQEKKERIERLGYDPEAKTPFQPKPKQKGRSSTASLVKRKRKVMDEEHRDKVRQSLEQHQEKEQEKVAKPVGARPSALDRFVR
ncbi:WD repeat-containing protein 46 isoform X2 [Choloepus didactylus]|uniref:WD repeat-containing protein 46 isoform X2 n=1 Tax=Choloepus didactylus TaxID=27675 RepID=UPI00189C7F88|nr:WD repeat-containing protein 46 isoform X2 [Choloepus didactylus]